MKKYSRGRKKYVKNNSIIKKRKSKEKIKIIIIKQQNKKKVVIIIIFSCGLSCQFPSPNSEPPRIAAYPGSPSMLLGRSLDLLWALWGQLRFWSALTPVFTCTQSPQFPPRSTASIVGTLVVYSDIPQMQGLPS